jgi:hypothetical protein
VVAKPRSIQKRQGVRSDKTDFDVWRDRLGNWGECNRAKRAVNLFKNLPSGPIVGSSEQADRAKRNDAVELALWWIMLHWVDLELWQNFAFFKVNYRLMALASLAVAPKRHAIRSGVPPFPTIQTSVLREGAVGNRAH